MRAEIKYLTYLEIKELIGKGWNKLIIPVGTLEPHGPHLPVGTDTIIPHELAKDIAEEIMALVAPPLEYGVVNSLLGYPGSTSLAPQTLENIMKEVILGFHKGGFRVFILLNGHGGNIVPIKNAQQLLWREHNIPTLAIHWWIQAYPITQEFFGQKGAHAGIDETAMIHAKYPELVRNIDTRSETVYITKGYDAYPSPGTLLVYDREQLGIAIKPERTKEYYKLVKEETIKIIKGYLERLRHFGFN